jgi:hypothetical protein
MFISKMGIVMVFCVFYKSASKGMAEKFLVS